MKTFKFPAATRTTLMAAGAALLLHGAAIAQVVELKLGHVGEPGSIFQISSDEYAKRVNAKLAGKYKVVNYGSSQLGGDKELIQKLKLGTIDIAVPSTVMSSEVDLFGIFDMPYIVKDRAHMARIEKEVFWPSIAPEAEKKGLKVLALWENGYRHITNNKKPIKEPADLQGIKPDEVLGTVHRASNRRHGWPGKSIHANLLGQTPGSAEVPVALRSRVHPRLRGGRYTSLQHLAGRCAQGSGGHGTGNPGFCLRRSNQG